MSPYYRELRKAAGDGLLLIPSVAAVIHDKQHRLLLQRKRDGSWSLPAGAIEPGETPEHACAREILEETGLRCTDFRLLAVLGGEAFRYTYPNGDAVEYVIVLYRCEVQPAEPIGDEETDYIEFFTRADIPALALPYDLDLLFTR